MAKGNPNEGKQQNFVFKVYDPITSTYQPAFIPLDATSTVLGNVYLSDAIDSDDNAETGVTAATPKAIKTVYNAIGEKLDKETEDDQSVNSDVYFSGKITVSNVSGVTANIFHGPNDGFATGLAEQINEGVEPVGINAGNQSTPIFFSNGLPVVFNTTYGASNQPIYLNGGKITPMSTSIGSPAIPVYMDEGIIKPINSSIGGVAKPVYVDAGEIKAITSTLGGVSKPVYLSAGEFKEISYTIEKSVPSDAKFTDTTYVVATSTANGLMASSIVTKINNMGTGTLVSGLTSVISSTISITSANWTGSASPWTTLAIENVFPATSYNVIVTPSLNATNYQSYCNCGIGINNDVSGNAMQAFLSKPSWTITFNILAMKKV